VACVRQRALARGRRLTTWRNILCVAILGNVSPRCKYRELIVNIINMVASAICAVNIARAAAGIFVGCMNVYTIIISAAIGIIAFFCCLCLAASRSVKHTNHDGTWRPQRPPRYALRRRDGLRFWVPRTAGSRGSLHDTRLHAFTWFTHAMRTTHANDAATLIALQANVRQHCATLFDCSGLHSRFVSAGFIARFGVLVAGARTSAAANVLTRRVNALCCWCGARLPTLRVIMVAIATRQRSTFFLHHHAWFVRVRAWRFLFAFRCGLPRAFAAAPAAALLARAIMVCSWFLRKRLFSSAFYVYCSADNVAITCWLLRSYRTTLVALAYAFSGTIATLAARRRRA